MPCTSKFCQAEDARLGPYWRNNSGTADCLIASISMAHEDQGLPYRFLEHTADVRMLVQGASWPDLLVHAALGLMEYVFGIPDQASAAYLTLPIDLSASDREMLLVDWLSELLRTACVRQARCLSASFSLCSEQRICGELCWQHAQAQREIKAVTYSELHITEHSCGWETIVTFDL